MEKGRALLRIALASAHAQREESTRVSVLYELQGQKMSPVGVRADKNYKKGQLLLVPLTPRVQIGARMPNNSVHVESFLFYDANGKQAHAFLPPKLELPPRGKIQDKSFLFLNAYWCVKVAPDSTLSNMKHGVLHVCYCRREDSPRRRQGLC